jgi:outer membrane protein
MNLIAGLLIITSLLSADAVPERTLTLDDAYTLALKHSLTVMQAANTAANADDDVWAAAGSMLPFVSLSGSRTRSWGSTTSYNLARSGGSSVPIIGTTSGTTRSDSYSASASASQVLFAGGSLARQYIAARANADAAHISYWSAKQDLLLATLQLYFNARASSEAAEAARITAETAKNHQMLTQRKLDLGAATQSDLLQAQTNALQAELTSLDATNAAAIAQATLCRALGIPLNTRLELSFELPVLSGKADESVYLERAESGRPEIALARANLAAARNSKWAVFGGFLPKVSADASYGWSDSEPPGTNPWRDHDYHSVGLNFSWDIFDQFSTPTSFSKQGRSVALAEENNRQVIEDTELQVHTAYLNFQKSEKRLELTTAARQSAAAALKLVERSYELGGATILELEDAQATALSAEVDYINAKYEGLVNWATLKQQMGELKMEGLWE